MRKFLKAGILLLLCTAILSGCGKGNSGDTGPAKTDGGKEVEAEDGKVRDFSNTDDISYVMIYNPKLYDENKTKNEMLNTGDFADYVEAVISKADGLEEVPEFLPYSSPELSKDIPLDGVDLSGSRGGAFITPYSVGDKHDFYCGQGTRAKKTFVCRYVGDNCNIWTCDDSASTAALEKCGREFDNNIYDKVVSEFGEPRFADEGGKINLLMYPLDENYLGFFYAGDLFATGEISPDLIAQYGMNTDHAIININSLLIGYEKLMYATMAHEFQQLI